MNPSPLKAREIEALTFIYSPTESSPGAVSQNLDAPPRSRARPLVGAAVALVVFAALAWIVTSR